VANQTTMLANESLAIAARIGRSLEARYGKDALERSLPELRHDLLRPQERQDAVLDLIAEPLDVMLVIAGTIRANTPTWRGSVQEAADLPHRGCGVHRARIRRHPHKPVMNGNEQDERIG